METEYCVLSSNSTSVLKFQRITRDCQQILNYGPEILKTAGLKNSDTATILLGSIMVLVTFISVGAVCSVELFY